MLWASPAEWTAPAPPHIDPDAVLRLNRYRNPAAASSSVRNAAQAMASLAAHLSAPHAWLRCCPIERAEANGTVCLVDGAQFCSRGLAGRLREASNALLILLTIGLRLERHAQELMARGDALEALMLDTAGTLAVYRSLRDLKGHVREVAAGSGFRLTPRLAPGYADWSLTEQRILFSRFDCPDLPVRLNDAGLMLPMKSVTGIYGLVPIRGSP
jgi:hypothetical protein